MLTLTYTIVFDI